MAQVKDLLDFLTEAELDQYFNNFRNDLKVTTVPQLKYVDDEDMQDFGMTKPEIRRLKKFFRKECPQGFSLRIKKLLGQRDADPRVTEPARRATSQPRVAHQIIAQDALRLGKLLGRGEFGAVHQAVWTTDEGEMVVTALQQVQHEHLVRLYGVALSEQTVSLVCELAPLRSLLECVKELALRGTFTVTNLCDLAVQIAQGMAYLESRQVVHRDLSCRNVLVFSKEKVKVSDAGLTRALGLESDYYESSVNAHLKIPIAWCAPECIRQQLFSSPSDVWAFGVTLWEMFSYGFQPWAALTVHQNGVTENGQSEDHTLAQQILDLIDVPSCQRLEQPDCCPRDLYGLLQRCWAHEPALRPTFAAMTTELPELRPERLKATRDVMGAGVGRPEYLMYRCDDVITVLDKRPDNPPYPGMWRGLLESSGVGKVGFFNPADCAPHVEIKTSPVRSSKRVLRRETRRKTAANQKARISVQMISGPQNDLRHTGHIGYDGAMFGDVAFIGNNYDKLPLKVEESPGSPALVHSISTSADDRWARGGLRASSVLSDVSMRTGGSQDLSDTLTDVSSWTGDADGVLSTSQSADDLLADRDTSLEGFRMPDFSDGLGLDLGTSFMDEVLRAINDTRATDAPDTTSQSALLDKDEPFTFENEALNDSKVTLTNGHGHGSSSSPPLSPAAEHTPAEKPAKNRGLKLGMDDLDFDYIDDDDEIIPSRDKNKSGGVKPLSASDERSLDNAIALTNEFAEKLVTTPPSADVLSSSHGSQGSEDGSRGLRGLLGLKRRSPKPEPRRFTDDLDDIRDVEDDLDPGSKEAYNQLVEKEGHVTDVKSDDVSGDVIGKRGSRELRMRRAMEHQRGGLEGVECARAAVPKHVPAGRQPNLHLRTPQGIPGRASGAFQRGTGGAEDGGGVNPLRALRNSQRGEEDSGVNPLRALRNSHTVAGRTRPGEPRAGPQSTVYRPAHAPESAHAPNSVGARVPSTAASSGSGSTESVGRPVISGPILTSRLSHDVMARDVTRDGSDTQSYSSGSSGSITARTDASPRSNDSGYSGGGVTSRAGEHGEPTRLGEQDTPPALPPREQLRSSTVNKPPRQRRYPLDTSEAGDDSVFLSPTGKTPGGGGRHFLHRNVKLSAQECGLADRSDPYWAAAVDFERQRRPSLGTETDEELAEALRPMAGRYKTSDTVSYEDLLDFALDSKPSEQTCDEIRLMRKVLSKEVTVEDCMVALQEAAWDVHQAIKFVKLKQLLSTELAELEDCKAALLRAGWDVDRAAADLLKVRELGEESPDAVDL